MYIWLNISQGILTFSDGIANGILKFHFPIVHCWYMEFKLIFFIDLLPCDLSKFSYYFLSVILLTLKQMYLLSSLGPLLRSKLCDVLNAFF